MFTIITGTPGASKTLNIISHLRYEKSRPIYYHGIELTEKGKRELGWIELDRHQAEEWHLHIPIGAIFILDEAQKIFPKKPAGAPIPPGLAILEEHRKSGFDVFFITQHPMLLHKHARDICNEHWHFSRSFGPTKPYKYHCGSGFIDPGDSKKLRWEAVRTKVPLDKSCFDLYVSAEVHTHKKRLPLRAKLLMAVPIIGVLAVILAIRLIGDFGSTPEDQAQASTAVESGESKSLFPSVVSRRDPFTWSDAYTPEIPGLPHTAPLYADEARKVNSVPRIAACIASKTSCHCYTQQATPIPAIPDQVCRRYVKNGVFDHMHEENRRESRGGDRPADAESKPVTAMDRLQRAIRITQETRLAANQ